MGSPSLSPCGRPSWTPLRTLGLAVTAVLPLSLSLSLSGLLGLLALPWWPLSLPLHSEKQTSQSGTTTGMQTAETQYKRPTNGEDNSEQKILEAYGPGLEVFYVWLQSLHNRYQAGSKTPVERNGGDVKHCSFVIICPCKYTYLPLYIFFSESNEKCCLESGSVV